MPISLFVPIALSVLLAPPLATHDVLSRRLPNRFTYPLIATSLTGTLLAAWEVSEYSRLLLAFVVAVIISLIGTSLAVSGQFGMGDVKLMLSHLLILGFIEPNCLGPYLLGAFGSATAYAIALMALRKKSSAQTIPFGPFLIASYLTCLPLAIAEAVY